MKVTVYTATWCGKCQQLKELYQECRNDHPGLSWQTVDVDDDPDAPVTTVPSVVISKEGGSEITLVGFSEISASLELLL